MDQGALVNVLNRQDDPSVFVTDAAMVDIAATNIRAASKSGDYESLQLMVPPVVANYIEKYGLYKN